jgi:adenylate cyclase
MPDLRIYSKRKLLAIGLGIGIGVTIVMLILFARGDFDFLENRCIDWRFLIRGEIKADPRIVIVSIDESSFSGLRDLGFHEKWPWPRNYFAGLIDRMSREGAKIIGIDIIMSAPYRGDEELAQSARRFGDVVFPSKFEETTTVRWRGTEIALEEFKQPVHIIAESGDVGYLNLPHDSDGFVRRFTPIRDYQGEHYASFDLKIVARFLGIPLADLKYAPFNQLRIGDRSIPLNHYNSAYINFAGPAGKFERISFSQVIAGLYAPGSFEGKIILLGATFLDSKDFFPTPFLETERGKFPLSGVEIHANIVNTILQGRLITPPSPVVDRLVILMGGMLVAMLSLRLSMLRGALLVLFIILAYLAASIWLFARDILLTTIAPVATFGAAYLSQVVFRYFTEEREKRHIRGMFQRYVSPDVVDKLIEDPAKLRLGGEKRYLSVLFSDIRGFTTISEKLAPEELLNQLNQYLSAMTAVVLSNGGMLDKYVGDAIMAVFGAPLEVENHALAACRTALVMMEELKSLQQEWENKAKPILDIGIGIHTGEMIIGNVGSTKRMDYTVIGDNVNLASRLEGVNKELGTHVIISGATRQLVEKSVRTRNLGEITVKGKERPVAIYELLEMK